MRDKEQHALSRATPPAKAMAASAVRLVRGRSRLRTRARQARVSEDNVDGMLDRIADAARREGRSQGVQVTVEKAGTLGIVVGADWSVLDHVPADLDPPYKVSVGDDQGSEPVVFYVAGDHFSEAQRRNTIRPEAARTAMRHFVAAGQLSPGVTWEET